MLKEPGKMFRLVKTSEDERKKANMADKCYKGGNVKRISNYFVTILFA